MVFLIPVMVVTSYMAGLLENGTLISNYLAVLPMVRFEWLATTMVTTLYLLNREAGIVLIHQNKELVEAKVKAEHSEKLKTAFLQNLSHEIRTPLNGIIGFSHLLNDRFKLDSHLALYTQTIVNCGEQLLSIVQDIIDISQIGTNQIENNASEFTLSETIDQVLELSIAKATERNVTIENIIKCNTSIKMYTDQYKVIRAVHHILDNAIKFGNNRNIKFTSNCDHEKVIFQIEDFGNGIPEKYHQLIFSNFWQQESEVTRKEGGNGVGLPIAKAFVESMGGRLSFQSVEKVGTKFKLEIPIALIND